ncbi:class IIb bacteriocin, lactobin A/cerein 7B family [Aquimarina algiphila]|uniref:class IIb bacteriocin, lactobin A/cerein 7B family n=1 Tax=Aquimarina algiphila TaxID=2047982 RepID=UPI00232D899E|nr:class IIb bacteriocin, lactobin A/cerein 7B family [Aquimarina algiphila]
MKNFDKFDVQELTVRETESINGGFGIVIAGIGAGIAAFSLGYAFGKDLYHMI